MKTILFITGTRADFGKLKPLIKAVQDQPEFECRIFVTGMHLLSKYGNTLLEIQRSGFENIFAFMNQMEGDSMDIILSNTVAGLSRYLHEQHVDMIVVHGDRVETLAGAIVGALRNILVAHIEGGEISGTIDELMRHATSKLSHLHFVSSDSAQKRLKQLGEREDAIFTIGSPDVDIMLSEGLPSLDQVKQRYQIKFDKYAVAILHPVTTELELQEQHAQVFVNALLASNENYVVIYPNNDIGSSHIFEAYKALHGIDRIKMFPSLRFEYFISLLKNARFIIGNSSVGIHEAPVYGVPTINIGSRQENRFCHESILNLDFKIEQILAGISAAVKKEKFAPSLHYGQGNSAEKFLEILGQDTVWQVSRQKKFNDLVFSGTC